LVSTHVSFKNIKQTKVFKKSYKHIRLQVFVFLYLFDNFNFQEKNEEIFNIKKEDKPIDVTQPPPPRPHDSKVTIFSNMFKKVNN